MSMQPFYFRAHERRLFGVLHPAVGQTRALVLMCPPLLHEHARSHRFFSQVAGRLAADGVACLRFDYHGTGDSEGDDADFSPERALEDIVCAASELRSRAGDHPLVLMGIRASALLAFHAAGSAGADALWLWLPVIDGQAYVQSLEAGDLEARCDRDRYPSRALPVVAEQHELMGFRTSERFRAQMASRSITGADTSLPVAVVTGPATMPVVFAHGVHHELPEVAADWVDELDMRSIIHLRDAESVLQALLLELPQREAEVVNG